MYIHFTLFPFYIQHNYLIHNILKISNQFERLYDGCRFERLDISYNYLIHDILQISNQFERLDNGYQFDRQNVSLRDCIMDVDLKDWISVITI